MIPQYLVAQIIDNLGGIQNITFELNVLAIPPSIKNSKDSIKSLIAEHDDYANSSICQLCLIANALSKIEISDFDELDLLFIEKLNFQLEKTPNTLYRELILKTLAIVNN